MAADIHKIPYGGSRLSSKCINGNFVIITRIYSFLIDKTIQHNEFWLLLVMKVLKKLKTSS